MAIADDDPYVEELLGNAPDRAAAALPRRELRAEMALGALLLAAVAALAILAPSERSLSPLVAVGLIAAFVVAQQVQFEVGIGYTVPSQLVVMPMLILAPPALVPLLVAAGLLIGRLPSYVRRDVHPDTRRVRAPGRLVRGRAGAGHGGAGAGTHRPRGLARPGLGPRCAGALRCRLHRPAHPACPGDVAPIAAAPVRLGARGRRRARPGRRPRRRGGRAPAARGGARATDHGPACTLRARAARAHRQGARALARLPRHRPAHERPPRGRRRLHRR